MIIEDFESLKVDSKSFQFWDDSAFHVVNKIFHFSERQGHSSLMHGLTTVLKRLNQNPYMVDYEFSCSNEIELLKEIINFYVDSEIWMYDPNKIKDLDNIPRANDAISIHQSFFILMSHCAIRLLKTLETNADDFINKDSIAKTIIRKQHDYGPENISKFGIWGIVVRVHDKIARIENLLSPKRNGKNAVSDETVNDTIVDIIGYSSVLLMFINGWFHLPMKDDNV